MSMTEYDPVKLCFEYENAPEERKQLFLDILNDQEREVFLTMYGFFRILTNKEYRDKIMAETMRLYLNRLKEELG